MRYTPSVFVALAAMAYALPAFAQNTVNGTNADTLAKAAPAAATDSGPAKAANHPTSSRW